MKAEIPINRFEELIKSLYKQMKGEDVNVTIKIESIKPCSVIGCHNKNCKPVSIHSDTISVRHMYLCQYHYIKLDSLYRDLLSNNP